MAKSDLSTNPLIPIVLVAGVLSGSLWRGTPPADTGKPADASANASQPDGAAAPVSWISDLRPVLESLDGALGARAGSGAASPLNGATSVTLAAKGEARDRQILTAMAGLRTGLDRVFSASEPVTCRADATLQSDANVLGAWMLVDDGGDARTRAAEARALLDEFRDWRLLTDLATGVKSSRERTDVPTYSVDFIVATMPDYVDSNSGWLADQGLAALQSGMAQEDYLFDRVKLIDWTRASAGSVTVMSGSRLHERQPGAIIFRHVDGRNIRMQVVLTVLETPTAGVHQVALWNSLSFLRMWNACSGAAGAALRVLGPSFSGSTLSLATVLGESPFPASFSRRIVITGSATADENPETMRRFSNGAIFRATVQPTSVLKARMAAYLTSLNTPWKDGNGVALLNESNTTYGRSSTPTGESGPFKAAKVFNFPLHIAQLRSDAPSLGQPGAALLSGPAIPLTLRETTPPSDVIPALRPQLTGPIVGATVDSILDAIRHEKISAVGIIATDDRDVLFLAREVKRASPDVQLFLFGTHVLYLHPDYVPYLRGALVASSYALTLANQPEIPGTAGPRQPFPSLSAEGVFYAARALLSLPDTDDIHYCTGDEVAATPRKCVPVATASISVVGEDGYWTLPEAGETAATAPAQNAGDAVPAPGEPTVAPLPPLPVRFSIGALLVLVVVALHVYVMLRIKRVFDDPAADRAFFELPLVRVLVPPRTFARAAFYHRFALTICFALVSVAAAWVVTIALPFFLPESALVLVLIAAITIFVAVFYVGLKRYGPRQLLTEGLTAKTEAPREPRRAISATEAVGWLLFAGMVFTTGFFLVLVWQTARGATTGAAGRLTLERIVGGGIVSPAALTVFLAGSFYTAVFTGLRRISLVGYGYGRLASGSPAFGLFTSERQPPAGEPRPGSLAGMLDMPAQNMPAVYPIAIVLMLAVAALGTTGVTTIDGRIFSWFVMVGTWTTLGLGLMQLAQGLAMWNTARSHLKRLAHTPIEKHLQDIAPQVPWDISLAPPRLTELSPIAHMADRVMRDFRGLAFTGRYGALAPEFPRDLGNIRDLAAEAEVGVGVRRGDLAALEPLLAAPSHVNALEAEMGVRQHAAIIQSDTWFGLWRLADALVTLLQRTAWRRSAAVKPARVLQQQPEAVGFGYSSRSLRIAAVAEPMPGGDDDPSHPERSGGGSPAGWFALCEQLVALQIAFVLRDIVARTVTCLFAAMLCLTSLTAAHLLYVFDGRASLLTVDMLAVALTALSAVWILIDMERDHVLSRLRSTTPGRVDINWEFLKRLAVYGVLPLLAVIAALFPEVGGTLFGWLEPLRKLSSF